MWLFRRVHTGLAGWLAGWLKLPAVSFAVPHKRALASSGRLDTESCTQPNAYASALPSCTCPACRLQKERVAAEAAAAEGRGRADAELEVARQEVVVAQQLLQAAKVRCCRLLLHARQAALALGHVPHGPPQCPQSCSITHAMCPTATTTRPGRHPNATQDDALRLEGELRDYKARAHALLKAKETELRSARDIVRCVRDGAAGFGRRWGWWDGDSSWLGDCGILWAAGGLWLLPACQLPMPCCVQVFRPTCVWCCPPMLVRTSGRRCTAQQLRQRHVPHSQSSSMQQLWRRWRSCRPAWQRRLLPSPPSMSRSWRSCGKRRMQQHRAQMLLSGAWEPLVQLRGLPCMQQLFGADCMCMPRLCSRVGRDILTNN